MQCASKTVLSAFPHPLPFVGLWGCVGPPAFMDTCSIPCYNTVVFSQVKSVGDVKHAAI